MKRLTMLIVCVLAVGTFTACTDEGVKPVDIATVPFTPPITTTSSTTSTATSSTTSSATSAVPSTTSEVTVTSTPGAIVETSTEPVATSTEEQISAHEAADRAAIEKVWREFWVVYAGIDGVPEEDRRKTLEPFAVDPILNDVLVEAQELASRGQTGFGSVVNHPYWQESVDDQATAAMGDCQDSSNFGAKKIASGDIASVGRVNNNMVGNFVEGDSGIWRVAQIVFVPNPCSADQ